MAEKVKRVGITKEKGRVYFLDGDGDISSSARGKAGKRRERAVGIKREAGYLYFVDKDGDVARAKMR